MCRRIALSNKFWMYYDNIVWLGRFFNSFRFTKFSKYLAHLCLVENGGFEARLLTLAMPAAFVWLLGSQHISLKCGCVVCT